MAIGTLRIHQHRLAQSPPDLTQEATKHIKSLLPLQLPQTSASRVSRHEQPTAAVQAQGEVATYGACSHAKRDGGPLPGRSRAAVVVLVSE